MYPHERSLVEEWKDRPFALIGVNSDKDLDKLRPRMEKENITWRSFWNGPEGTRGPIARSWDVTGWPTIYILDGKGIIRERNKRNEEMDAAVLALIAEAEGE